jgi:UDP-3-O-[3-hydroxymyristoyl] N-acetylglucosamine deacetylase
MTTDKQQTLGASFELSGIGLHSGVVTHVRVLPAEAGEGRYFVRVDLPDSPQIPARVKAVVSTTLSTELGEGSARVRTVEHLLCALAGSGVDNARIEIDGPEVPLLDGSALEWVKAISQVGVVPFDSSPDSSFIFKNLFGCMMAMPLLQHCQHP